MDVTQAPPQLPPPPAPPAEQRTTWGMRPAACALLCVLTAAIAAVFAYRLLWPYPPRNASAWLSVIVVAASLLGLLAGSLHGAAARKRAVAAAVIVAIAAPFVAATTVPGIAQPRNHVIPGGRTEAISAAPDGNFDLYLMPHGDPSQLVSLTDTDDAAEEYPHLDPTGTKIAYTKTTSSGESLHLAQLGEDRRIASDTVLIPPNGDRLWATTWTPDGQLLVAIDPPDAPTRVLRLNVESGARSAFLQNAANVSYSADGSRIAFAAPSAADAGNWDIWVADEDGSHARDVLHSAGDEDFPAWSPDGRRLLFTSWVTGNADVYTAAADGSDVRNLTSDSLDRDTSLDWSSDGHVLFLSNRSHTGGVFQYFMNDDGSDVQLALRI